MKRLFINLRIAGTGAIRIVFICVALLLLFHLVLTLFFGWSDRRFCGNVWFYHDLRYWPNVCSSLLWVAVFAMICRIGGLVLSRVLVKENSRYKRRWRIFFGVFDGVERTGTLVACICFLLQAGLSFSTLVATVGTYWHWLFDPVGVLILQGPGSAALKGMPMHRFLWLPGIVLVVIWFVWLLGRYTSIISASGHLIVKSWLASFVAIGVGAFFVPVAKSFLSWFIDGFYRVPVTLFMASGRMTWQLFVIPGLFVFFVAVIILSRRKQLDNNTPKREECFHE